MGPRTPRDRRGLDFRTARSSARLDVLADMAWLLENARENSTVPGVKSAAGFARAGAYPTVDRSTVTRWERGQSTLTFELVRRYERVLELPYGQLLSCIEDVARLRIPGVRSPVLMPSPDVVDPGPPEPPRPGVQDLLDLVVTGERLTGRDWDELTMHLVTREDWIIPTPTWRTLLERLTLEVGTSVGLEFTLRDHALYRLASAPRSATVATALAREQLYDPTTQVFGDTVAMLQHTSDPGAVRLLLDYLTRPTASAGQWVCLFVLSTCITEGRLTPEEVNEAGQLAMGLLRDDSASPRLQREAANLLRSILPQGRKRLVDALNAQARPGIAHILEDGSILGDRDADALVRRVRSLVQSAEPSLSWSTRLQDLLRIATTTTHDEQRGNVLAVLMLIPQNAAVAAAYGQQLRSASTSHEAVLVDDALSALHWLAQPDQVEGLLELAFAPDTDHMSSRTAAGAAGNVRVVASVADRISGQTLAIAVKQMRDDLPETRSAARAHAYLLGMWGRTERLRELRRAGEEPGVDPAWAAAAQWWLDLPGYAQPRPLPHG